MLSVLHYPDYPDTSGPEVVFSPYHDLVDALDLARGGGASFVADTESGWVREVSSDRSTSPVDALPPHPLGESYSLPPRS